MLFEPLSQEKRTELLLLVTDEQKDFLLNKVKRGRRTIFGNLMVEEKVHAIQSVDTDLQEDERSVEDWEIVDYVDFGFGNRHGKCACGKTLRHMFTVQHKKTEKKIPYGIDHLSAFLNLEIKDIKSIINGVKVIDYELDELLLKIRDNDYGYEILKNLPEEIEIPEDIQEHVDHHIPLLENQINKIERRIKKYKDAQLEKANKGKHEELNFVKSKAALELAQEIIRNRYESERKQREAREQEILESIRQILAKSNPTISEIATALVYRDVSSAKEISRIIRNNFNVDKRTSIGTITRPYIYMDVVLALMNEVNTGTIIFDHESSTIEDCYFYPSDEEQLEETSSQNYQPSLF